MNEEKFLLDTNAYFNFLLYATHSKGNDNRYDAAISKIQNADCYLSQISLIEIISVLGKYARGKDGGIEKCNCIIDTAGTVCPNSRIIESRKKWPTKRKKAWLKYLDDVKNGVSNLLTVHILPIDNDVLQEAEKIIMLSLDYKFASMDSIIAATACVMRKDPLMESLKIVTSDKSLKAGLAKYSVPIWDAFAN